MDLLIRAANLDDAEGIVAVFNPIILAGKYTAFSEPFSAEAEREFIQTYIHVQSSTSQFGKTTIKSLVSKP